MSALLRGGFAAPQDEVREGERCSAGVNALLRRAWVICTRTRCRACRRFRAEFEPRDQHLQYQPGLFGPGDEPDPFGQEPDGRRHPEAGGERCPQQHRRRRADQRAVLDRFEPVELVLVEHVHQPPRPVLHEGPDRQPDLRSGEQRHPDQRSGERAEEPLRQPRQERHQQQQRLGQRHRRPAGSAPARPAPRRGCQRRRRRPAARRARAIS